MAKERQLLSTGTQLKRANLGYLACTLRVQSVHLTSVLLGGSHRGLVIMKIVMTRLESAPLTFRKKGRDAARWSPAPERETHPVPLISNAPAKEGWHGTGKPSGLLLAKK